jgi:hypothetical protein
MSKSCIVCRAVASLDLQLQYCAQCQSALYCSKDCQREDWKEQHKKICKHLNVGHGGMQVRNDIHTSRQSEFKEEFEEAGRSLDDDEKQFFKLFEESTFEGSRAAARKMKKIAKRQTKQNQKCLLFHSLYLLVHSDNEKLRWPNSPLLVMLQFVDPNVRSRDEHERLEEGTASQTPLHNLGELVAYNKYSTHENQLVLAKQLIEHGANVNAVSSPQRETPLHKACSWDVVTNLDFVELLLTKGADPNAQDHLGLTPLMYTTDFAPGVAKFLLNWPTMDVNITNQSGQSFLVWVRTAIMTISDKDVRSIVSAVSDATSISDSLDQVKDQFLLRQWREIEEMLVERGAEDTSMTCLMSMIDGRLFRLAEISSVND